MGLSVRPGRFLDSLWAQGPVAVPSRGPCFPQHRFLSWGTSLARPALRGACRPPRSAGPPVKERANPEAAAASGNGPGGGHLHPWSATALRAYLEQRAEAITVAPRGGTGDPGTSTRAGRVRGPASA